MSGGEGPAKVGGEERGLHHLIEDVAAVINFRGVLARVAYALRLHPPVSVVRYSVAVSGLTPNTPPLRIGFASDFHAGLITDRRVTASAFAALRGEAPDILLFGGDFVCHKAKYVDELCEHLKSLEAPLGKFAVLGNHDYWTDTRYVAAGLGRAGVRVLVNENVRLGGAYGGYVLCGLDDPGYGRPDADAAFRGADGVKILLTHSPDGVRMLGRRSFDVGLCGHTHGGQVALPNGKPILLPEGVLCKEYPHGRFLIEGDDGRASTLIVSRGVGCSTLPFRLFSDPDVVVCTCVLAAGGDAEETSSG